MDAVESTALLRRGELLARLTIAWNVVEALVAVGAGIVAGSIALVGFGLDSLIEVFAASVVLWELRGRDGEREARALRLIGGSFFALALYVTVESVWDLAGGREAETSMVGIVLAAVSLAVMPALAFAKRRVGEAAGSRVLVADSKETLLCAWLSLILLVGLGLNASVGWWWSDPVAALGIAALAVREGREAWAEPGGDDD